ncbi:hypothetical protein ACAG26_13800 [Mycobacterium sp. pUA109]|uniref:hypothetical protein n=1 Tax=Mycobacterium sp. pUA109 TaxID=3238982 RepID=UPI00351ADECF
MKRSALLVVVMLGWLGGACMSSRQNAAESLERQIRAMAGVSDTQMEYKSSVGLGSSLKLAVTLDPSVTDAQAGDVGRVFADELHRQGFDGHVVDFAVSYPAVSDSTATFHFYETRDAANPATAKIADGLEVWLRVARSPIATQATLRQPESGSNDVHQDFTVALRPQTTAAQAEALQRDEPALAAATWCIDARQNAARHGYCSTPAPPSDHDKNLWDKISAAAGPDNSADGRTAPRSGVVQADTDIGITIESPTNTDAVTDQVARSVAALLPQFGHPTALVVDTKTYYRNDQSMRSNTALEIVVGGCYRHQPYHERTPLELELSAMYEKC